MILYTGTPGPNGDWGVGPELNSAICDYEARHPDRWSGGVLSTIANAIEQNRLQVLLELIPDNLPVPVQSIVKAVVALAKLGIQISRAKRDVLEFMKEIIRWVMDEDSAFRSDESFDRELWSKLEHLRDLINDISTWATARLNDPRKRFYRRLFVPSVLADFKSKLEKAKSDYVPIAITVVGQRQVTHIEETRAIRGTIVAQRLDAAQQAFLRETLAPRVASKTSYIEQGKSKCAANTRVAIIRTAEEWVSNQSDHTPRLFWITGVPGTGKSTLVATLASMFKDTNVLYAQYLFSRSHADTTNQDNFFPSIASQLVGRSPVAASAIYEALQEKRSLVDNISELQAVKLLVEPIQALSQRNPLRAIVVVVDALDECERQGREIAIVLKSIVSQLPSNARILISSRAEHAITLHFSDLVSRGIAIHTDLDTSDPDAIQDVSLYLRKRLTDITGDLGVQVSEWPGESSMRNLCNQASGLFIWAVTAANFIQQQLDTFGRGAFEIVLLELNREGIRGIDSLYHTILVRHFADLSVPADSRAFKQFRQAVGCICTLQEPLPVANLKSFLSLKVPGTAASADIHHFMSRHRALLVPGTEGISDRTIPRLHPSFFEFITDPKRAQQFFIDLETSNAESAVRCFNLLNTLRRDMCDIERFATFNADIPDLSSRIEEHLPPQLRYACRFWSVHLSLTGEGPAKDGLPDRLKDFLETHLLHWIELASLLDYSAISVSLDKAADWAARNCSNDCYTVAKELIYDAGRLTTTFVEPILQSAPHVYISALPFAPKSSRIHQQYHKSVGCAVEVLTQGLRSWPTYNWLIHGHNDRVNAVCFSPDGTRIMSCSDDGTIQLWTTLSGQRAAPPFTGHADGVLSCAISPDGKRMVSGSSDKSLRFWDVAQGRVISESLVGSSYQDAVISVAFSHDGQMVASGSSDGTIRRWDAVTLQPYGPPIQGHVDFVNSVAFSADDAQIVSGSDDCAVCRWDAYSGELVGQPLLGHTGWVRSVAVSLDGKMIASGGSDRNIRLWDATDGRPIGSPLEGHSDAVYSVAFSPDGTRLASGSKDQTIRLWDVAGACAIGMFKRLYSDWIRSVAFSPNGKQVVSCSDSGTICLSDAISFAEAAAPPEGHSEAVTCVAFSPSGRLVASGSHDETVCLWEDGRLVYSIDANDAVRTIAFSVSGDRFMTGGDDGAIRLWDTATGCLIMPPLVGHAGRIGDIAVSPDGRHIASASFDGTLRLWDAARGRAVGAALGGHAYRVRHAAFAADGAQLASGADDGTVRRWDVAGRAPRGAPLAAPGWVEFVAFVPGGTALLARSWDAMGSGCDVVRAWDTASGALTATMSQDEAARGGASGQQAEYSRYFALRMSNDRWLRTTASGALVAWLPPALFGADWQIWAHHGAKVVVASGDERHLAIIDTMQVLRSLGSEPRLGSMLEEFRWTCRSRSKIL